MSVPTAQTFASHLVADAPTAAYPSRMALFGRLVGTWSIANEYFNERTQEWSESDRTWVFSYVLGGRAVQDVITGSADCTGNHDEAFGSSVRVYDASIGAWRVNWFGTATNEFCALVAIDRHGDILQDGTQTDGRPIRWNYLNITEKSFDWEGYVSNDEGRTWWLQQRMLATRRG
ncbi:hypothetical protein GCM10022198_14750 [Klugiella xanthotipulae]|uniref:DUF1579 domain-containing protein n=1 Tax=Klugiella xanthotipulae TaxID=244735 RepID=A0A543I6K3_9MICO|nr:hypothetical protein [Klugiella xanthotipulae]TQM66233.1 hypothetical protein FB466_1067 [Klugiella xanthotipulae]